MKVMNSDTTLFNRTVKHSLSMSSTTLAKKHTLVYVQIWYL